MQTGSYSKFPGGQRRCTVDDLSLMSGNRTGLHAYLLHGDFGVLDHLRPLRGLGTNVSSKSLG